MHKTDNIVLLYYFVFPYCRSYLLFLHHMPLVSVKNRHQMVDRIVFQCWQVVLVIKIYLNEVGNIDILVLRRVVKYFVCVSILPKSAKKLNECFPSFIKFNFYQKLGQRCDSGVDIKVKIQEI